MVTNSINNAKVYLRFGHWNKDSNMKNYIDSTYSDMFSPWQPKFWLDVFILTEYQKFYNIIKVVLENISTKFKLLLQNILFYKYQEDFYSLFCTDFVTSAIKVD